MAPTSGIVGFMKKRCRWARPSNPVYVKYHDQEWGRARRHSERYLFEMICLEGAQAGLSWETILMKREAYRKAFHRFDPGRCARMSSRELGALMKNAGIVRNRMKIASVRDNARAYLALREEFGTFAKYLRGFDDSVMLSKDLKKRGFRFVGPTIVYAFMQAIGMVNDHEPGCFLSSNRRSAAK